MTKSAQDEALVALLQALREEGYSFITPTPLTHSRIWQRRNGEPARSLRDVLGWNLPFERPAIPARFVEMMKAAGVLAEDNGLARSSIRVSSLGADLFAHSSFPTGAADSVFFGPDTYRFAGFIEHELRRNPARNAPRVLDVGCGSGAGAVAAARQCEGATLVMNDINPLALRYAMVNAAACGLPAQAALGDALSAVQGDFDLLISNPPYLVDDALRAYRHGGDRLGRALSVRIGQEALGRLAPGGMLLLYTGVAIVEGVDHFLEEMRPLMDAAGCEWRYREIDPDVFGEELDRPAYQGADRVAAVGLTAIRKSP